MRARIVLVIVFAGGAVFAQNPDEAPAPCRAQIATAIARLAPAYAGKVRKITAKAPGSIEAAIGAYAPGRFHEVDEGTLPSPKKTAKCPSEMAFVASRVCVDKYEGSIVLRDVDATGKPTGPEIPQSPYLSLPADKIAYARSLAGVVPQAYISAKQAEGACRASGKRLCQAVEWRVACAGSEGTTYPYGGTRAPGKCHDSGASPMLTYHLASMKRGWGATELNDTRNNQLEGTVAKTGSFPDCSSDEGVFDMVGNLHEWTADPNGTFQGGYWLDTSQHGDGCAYRTIAHGYEYHDYSTGFRCCADPEGAIER